MGEYYIRNPDEADVHGPFDEGQLNSLAEAGKITLTTLITDESKNNWAPVSAMPELKAVIFPEKKKLGLKRDAAAEKIELLNKPEDAAKPQITVQEMLAAAEGQTTETKHLRDTQKALERSAALAPLVLAVIMLLSGLSNVLPRYSVFLDIYNDNKWELLAQEPFAVVGFIDLFFALCLFLGVTSIFPLVRFRAMLGLGFFLFYYWSLEDMWGQVASVCAGLGLFVCTLMPRMVIMLFFAIVGVGGMGYLAWRAWVGLAAAG